MGAVRSDEDEAAMRILIARIKQRSEYEKIAAQRALPAPFMSARQAGPYDNIARKWLALAERRKAFLIALRDSGRWQDFHYSDEAELEAQLREVDLACVRFASIAGPEAADTDVEAAAA